MPGLTGAVRLNVSIAFVLCLKESLYRFTGIITSSTPAGSLKKWHRKKGTGKNGTGKKGTRKKWHKVHDRKKWHNFISVENRNKKNFQIVYFTDKKN